ncbi:hypothetical protein [Variovorax boronicumulans]
MKRKEDGHPSHQCERLHASFEPGIALPGLDVMRHAADSKVTTTVVTNSLAATDEPLVYVAYARQRTAMLKHLQHPFCMRSNQCVASTG